MSKSEVKVRRVEIERLDPERFEPYGEVIGERFLTFPESDPGEGRMALEMFSMKKSPRTRETIGFHFAYSQPIIVLEGTFGLLVAPPPGDPKVTLENARVDYDKLAAFEIHGGEAVMIRRGVWHDFSALGDSCRILHYTRRLTNERGSSPAEMINMRERDNLVVCLESAVA
jgi:ureidoglycolate hydrolase